MTDDQIKAETVTNEADPSKTVTLLTTPEKEKDEKSKVLEVNAETVVDPNDSAKTITTLSSPDVVKVTVRGPFFGSTEVNKGSSLKEALMVISHSNDSSYGNFKYRNEAGEPVGLTYEVNEATILQSLKKGE